MEATRRGLFVGGDGSTQGGLNTGRVAFYDFNSVPAPTKPDTTITAPIEGRVVPAGTPFSIQGKATVSSGRDVQRVDVEVQQRGTSNYLQDDLSTWGPFQHHQRHVGCQEAQLSAMVVESHIDRHPRTSTTSSHDRLKRARREHQSTQVNGDLQLRRPTPSTDINGPSSPQASTSFRVTGTATDDTSSNALSLWFRDEDGKYLQDDGSVDAIYNTFRTLPDVVGATSASWSHDVNLPHEGVWRGARPPSIPLVRATCVATQRTGSSHPARRHPLSPSSNQSL